MNPRHQLAAALVLSLAPLFPSATLGQLAPRDVKAAPPRADGAVAKTRAQAPAQAKSAVPPKPVADPEAERKMEALLIRWAEQSKLVRSLSVPYERVDESELFAVKKTFKGQAQLQSPDFVYLDFIEVVNGKPKAVIDERIVCDGKNVYQFVGLTKRIWVYPLDQDPRKKALNQGPLPFLFDMTVAKAHQRYVMEYLDENATSYVLRIIPKLAIDREEFTQAMVLLDKESLLPAKIKLWSPDGNETKTFKFDAAGMTKNVAIAPGWFDGPKQVADATRDRKAGWVVTYNPKPDADLRNPANAPAPRNAPAAGAVGSRPAAKGAGVRQK